MFPEQKWEACNEVGYGVVLVRVPCLPIAVFNVITVLSVPNVMGRHCPTCTTYEFHPNNSNG